MTLLPYNTNQYALERVRELLDMILERGETDIPTADPRRLSYRIREGIRAARAHNIEPYASMHISVKVREDHVAIRRQVVDFGTPQKPGVVVSTVKTEFEVVAFLRDAKPDRYVFNGFTGRLTPVDSWAAINGWRIEPGPPLVVEPQTNGGHMT